MTLYQVIASFPDRKPSARLPMDGHAALLLMEKLVGEGCEDVAAYKCERGCEELVELEGMRERYGRQHA